MTTPQNGITLTNGVRSGESVLIPQVGFGTWKLEGPEAQVAVEDAIATGYRHIDTAAAYYNEEEVGAGIKASGVPREDIFVTTKLRNGDQGYESTLAAFEDSRKRLGLDVIDLYLIHWPVPSLDKYLETWRAFEKLLADGAVRSIGVSNFLPEHLDRLIAASEITPAVNQFEVHPTFQQRDLSLATAKAGIAIEAYSPLGRGADLEADSVVAIADRLGVSTGQVVLRWHLQQGRIVIPKSANPERIRANLAVTDFSLTDADLAAIDALEDGNRQASDPATADFTQYR